MTSASECPFHLHFLSDATRARAPLTAASTSQTVDDRYRKMLQEKVYERRKEGALLLETQSPFL